MSPGVGPAQPGAGAIDLLTAYQQSAIVAAACKTGVADALHAEPAGAEQTAARAGTDPRATRALLNAMVVLGLAERDGGKFSLTSEGAPLALAAPDSIASIVNKEWFFYGVWRELPEAIADGHARITPWTDRLENDTETAHGFLRALDDLASRFGGELPGLAALDPGTRLLDAGGGSGSHSAALVAAVNGIEATVLDLPAVEPVLRERHPELTFVRGDLREPRFGRPAEESWDAVLLGNVIHDQDPETARSTISEAAGLLRPGGRLVLYEWVLEDSRDRPETVALFALMMLVENEGGNAYTEQEFRDWLQDAGLETAEIRRGGGPICVVTAVKPG